MKRFVIGLILLLSFSLFSCKDNPASPNTSAVSTNDLSTTTKVIEYVESKLGANMWEWNTSTVNVLVIRGAGSGFAPSVNEHSYDDVFIVAHTNGTVYKYDRGNSEGTIHPDKIIDYGYNVYLDPNLSAYCTPALAPGRYKFKVGTHPATAGYKALNLYGYDSNSRYNLPSQRRNGKNDGFTVSGVNLHKGGDTWNYSVGCLTLHYSQYDDFIAKFTTDKWGRLYIIGNYNSTGNI